MEKIAVSLKKLLKTSVKLFLKILYLTFVVTLSFGTLITGIITVIPAEAFGWEVSKVSYLGYYSTCAFAPISTLILFGLAAIGFFLLVKLQRYLVKKSKNSVLYVKLKAIVKK